MSNMTLNEIIADIESLGYNEQRQNWIDNLKNIQRNTDTLREAARYRALMENFKHDYIWYHVFDETAQAMGETVEAVLDNIVENGYPDEVES